MSLIVSLYIYIHTVQRYIQLLTIGRKIKMVKISTHKISEMMFTQFLLLNGEIPIVDAIPKPNRGKKIIRNNI